MNLFLPSVRSCLLSVLLVATSSVAFSATIVSAGSGNWSATAWPNTVRTGTITTSMGSAAVVGVGTAFTTEISVGSIIKTTGNVPIGTVLSVTDDTHLTLTGNAASDNADIGYNFQGIGSADIASIQGGHVITIDNAGAVCAALGGSNTGVGGWQLVFNAGSALTVTGVVTIGDAGHSGSVDMTNGGTLKTGGFAVVNGGTWTPGSGTVEFTATNTLPTTFLTSFNNLVFSTGTTTATVGLTITGDVLTDVGSGIDAMELTHSIAGNITNNGAFVAGAVGGASTIVLNGTTQQIITNNILTGTGHIENLTINNTGGGILLGSDITVFTHLIMTQGNIDLGGHQLALGSFFDKTGVLTRTSGTMVGAGSFLRWFPNGGIPDGSDAGLFPVGTTTDYNPLFVSVPGGSTGGTLAVGYNAASGTSTVNIPDGTSNIVVLGNSSWVLTTPGIIALPAITSGFFNLRAEGTGLGAVGNVDDLRLSLLASVTGTAGTNGGTITNPQVNRTGIAAADLYQAFFIGSVDATSTPLPITLLSFTASSVNGTVKLDWETTSEINNDHFTIQRSVNSVNWEDVKVVAGAGNSSVNVKYTAYDETPYPGTSYYRLQQTDRDGKTTYSPIVSVKNGQSASLRLYPNPATDQIRITTPGRGKLNVALFNSSGRRMDVPVSINENSARLNVSGLDAGTYFVQIIQGAQTESRAVLINK